MQTATSIQTKCDCKDKERGTGYAAKVRISLLCVTNVALTPDGRPKPLSSILKEVLPMIKNRQGITVPELAKKLNVKDSHIQNHVESLSQRLLVKKGGKKRQGHFVWVA